MTNSSDRVDEPLVSVIIPAFNRATLIGETLDSVIAQSYTHWECIIVDDGSTDNTIQVIEEYCVQDKRFTLYKRDREPKGAPTCRNIGLESSKGEYIIFLDSDDLLDEDCIKHRIKNIELNPDYDLWTYPMLLFNDRIDDLNILSNIETDEDVLDRFLSRDQLWLMTGPIWKRTELIRIGGFDEKLKSQQDLEIHARALAKGLRYKYFDRQPDTFYRQNIPDQPFRGQNAYTMAQLDSYTYLINKLRRTLKSNNELTKKRELLLKRFLFWNLIRWQWFYKESRYKAIVKPQINWIKAYLNRLITINELFLGSFYFLYETLTPYKKLSLPFLLNMHCKLKKHFEYLEMKPSMTMAKISFNFKV